MTRLELTHHPNGVSLGDGRHVVYELAEDKAFFGQASSSSEALVFSLEGGVGGEVLLAAELDVAGSGPRLIRCDRIDFPPGGIAHTHTHPGPGVRCQLAGSLTVETEGESSTFGPLDAWFESGPEPVYAEAHQSGPAAFVRVLILPVEWAGRRTIRYIDPADEEKPKLQKATVYLEEEVLL